MARNTTPGGVDAAKIKLRRTVVQASERTHVLVQLSCDRCGVLPATPTVRTDPHASGVDHTLRFSSHVVTLRMLNTTTYRNPSHKASKGEK